MGIKGGWFCKKSSIFWFRHGRINYSKKDTKKSCGIDKIPDVAVKKAGEAIILFLTILFNHYLNIDYYHIGLKEALAVQIPKTGADATMRGAIDRRQFGYRAIHSTTHNLAAFTTYITDGFKSKMETIVIGLDFLYKIQSFWFHEETWQARFLQERVFRVRVGEKLFERRLSKSGAPQGSLLGLGLVQHVCLWYPCTSMTFYCHYEVASEVQWKDWIRTWIRSKTTSTNAMCISILYKSNTQSTAKNFRR